MAKGKYITEEKYRKIRALWLGGFTTKEIMLAEDVSEETVRRCKKAETYEQYKVYCKNHNRKNHVKKCDSPVCQQEQIEFKNDEFEKEDEPETKDILTSIANLLQGIVYRVLDLAAKGEQK